MCQHVMSYITWVFHAVNLSSVCRYNMLVLIEGIIMSAKADKHTKTANPDVCGKLKRIWLEMRPDTSSPSEIAF